MEYDLHCECGETLTVRETAAGAKEQCRCGRMLVVPSLHELRRSAGLPEPGLSPEKVVEALLLADKLPEEDRCVLCGAATDGLLCCRTECERAYIQRGGSPWWIHILGFLTFGWVGVIAAQVLAEEDREWGKDRIFPLPLRVCGACQHGLTEPAESKAALRRIAVYRRLLEKYPYARVTISSP